MECKNDKIIRGKVRKVQFLKNRSSKKKRRKKRWGNQRHKIRISQADRHVFSDWKGPKECPAQEMKIDLQWEANGTMPSKSWENFPT